MILSLAALWQPQTPVQTLITVLCVCGQGGRDRCNEGCWPLWDHGVDPRWASQPGCLKHHSGHRRQPETAPDGLHRPVSDPLAGQVGASPDGLDWSM